MSPAFSPRSKSAYSATAARKHLGNSRSHSSSVVYGPTCRLIKWTLPSSFAGALIHAGFWGGVRAARATAVVAGTFAGGDAGFFAASARSIRALRTAMARASTIPGCRCLAKSAEVLGGRGGTGGPAIIRVSPWLRNSCAGSSPPGVIARTVSCWAWAIVRACSSVAAAIARTVSCWAWAIARACSSLARAIARADPCWARAIACACSA